MTGAVAGASAVSHWLDGEVRSAWRVERPARTLDELREKRRHLAVPDPTYDLNGDGVVDNSDLFIASMFDGNHDGHLDAHERQRCRDALRTGFDKQWVLTSSGPVRSSDISTGQKWICHVAPETSSRTASKMRRERRLEQRSAAETGLNRARPPVRRPRTRQTSDHLPIDISHPGSGSMGGIRPCTAATRSDLLQQRNATSSRAAVEHLERALPGRKRAEKHAESICFGNDHHDYQSHNLADRAAWRRACWTPPSDPAKSEHVLNRRRQHLAGTIGRMPVPDPEPPSTMLHDLVAPHNIHISDLCREKRVWTPAGNDVAERARPSEIKRADLLPMYSSFTSDNIFREPTYMQLRRKHPITQHTNDHVENIFRGYMEKTGAGAHSRPNPGLPIQYGTGDRQQMVSVLLSRNKSAHGPRCQTAIRSRAFPTAIRT